MNFKKLTDFNENIKESIELELNNLNSIYENLKTTQNEIITFSKNNTDEIFTKFNLLIPDIEMILSLIDISKKILTNSLSEYLENNDKNYLISKIDVYNYICDKLHNLVSKLNDNLQEFNSLKESVDISNGNETSNINTNLLDNNTLLISEKKNAVILPYKHEEIKKMLDTGNYNSEEEIIEKLYTIPLSEFNNSAISRFNEGYKLITKKEKGSFSYALDLGLELMFKTNLHPALIRACKNIRELDFLLDCIDQNRLSDFGLFKIKFEMCPSII